jgi:hypothetical protein
MTVRPLTAEDAGKRVRIVLSFTYHESALPSKRAFVGTLVWDDKTDPGAPIGLQTIAGSTQQADLWFKAGTEGEVLE